LNAGSTTGPVLPSGYIAYAPAFPIILVGSATLQPTLPQGGNTTYRVRGNHVTIQNVPFISGAAFPAGTLDMSPWVPPAYLTVDLYADLELTFAATGIGGAVLGTSEGNFWNASLYCGVSAFPCAMDGAIPNVFLPARTVNITFSKSSGTFSSAVGVVGPMGYTFPQ
jgi:hypothetical protein